MAAETVAAGYAVETVVEGAAVGAYAIAKATPPLKGTWKKIPTIKDLPRSSHTLSVIRGQAYVFGGEMMPREPVESDVHIFQLPASTVGEADYIKCLSSEGNTAPPPRVGHTASVIGDRVYIFGGRGGKDMEPLEESGRVWVLDTKLLQWSYIDPLPNAQFPGGRSYHSSAASEHPLPAKQEGNLDTLGSGEKDGYGTIFIQGGCRATGRTSDLWAFDVAARTWSPLPDAPGPARGGASLTFVENRLYRFGGFCGESEQGGRIDYLEFLKSTIMDQSGTGEIAMLPKTGDWESITFDASHGPGNRSLAGLHPVTIGQGRNYLVLFLGEKDPSASGHDGAGKFWDDVWSLQLRPEGMTAASFKDATRQLFGAKTGEGQWTKVLIPESTKSEGQLEMLGSRAWFASAAAGDLGANCVVLWGGLDEANERRGDGWTLELKP